MHIKIVEVELKTTCVTYNGAYKFLVMLFKLTNALVMFSTLINKILYPYLNNFDVVYLVDIVVYSSMKEHVRHLRIVFQVLKRMISM